MNKIEAINCSRSISCARQCLIRMSGLREHTESSTFRGVTGYLSNKFQHGGMGMDYAFFSTSTSKDMAVEFTKSEEKCVVFEVVFQGACPGVDVESISVFPGEKEILFPPCTGLSLMGAHGNTGHVKVIPSAAQETRLAQI